MSTRARGLPGRWSGLISILWLLCVLVVAWLDFRQESSTSQTILHLVALVLGLALGVAIVEEGRTVWIVFAVPMIALCATLAARTSYASLPVSEQGLADGFDWELTLVMYVVLLSVVVSAGVLLGATWRTVQRRLRRSSIHR